MLQNAEYMSIVLENIFPKDWFIRQIREMSYMKMNALQIHFSENMGFRIECETDPSIVSDQYLTKTEVREILAEAKKYGINVLFHHF